MKSCLFVIVLLVVGNVQPSQVKSVQGDLTDLIARLEKTSGTDTTAFEREMIILGVMIQNCIVKLSKSSDVQSQARIDLKEIVDALGELGTTFSDNERFPGWAKKLAETSIMTLQMIGEKDPVKLVDFVGNRRRKFSVFVSK